MVLAGPALAGFSLPSQCWDYSLLLHQADMFSGFIHVAGWTDSIFFND